MSLRNCLYDKLRNVPNMTIVSPPAGPLASPMLSLMVANKFKRPAFVKMLLDKHKLSTRPKHPEFGFNGTRFSMHISDTANQVDWAASILKKSWRKSIDQ